MVWYDSVADVYGKMMHFYPWYEHRINITSVIIARGVTSIGLEAFFQYPSLISCTLPEGIRVIGNYAFRQCNSLVNIHIPASVDTLNVASIIECRSLSISVSPDNPHWTVEDGALLSKDKTALVYFFKRGVSAYTVPSSVTSIEGLAFCSSSLTAVAIPASVTHVGVIPFHISAIKSVTCFGATPPAFKPPDDLWDFNYAGCTLNVPSASQAAYKAADTSWGNFAFPSDMPQGECGAQGNNVKWMLDLTSGTLFISGTGAMKNYQGMGADQPWRSYDANIKNISIGGGVTSIGKGAFYAHNELTNVAIPAGMMRLRWGCLRECSKLTGEISIPASVDTIESSVFTYTPISSFSVHADNQDYTSENGVIFNKTKTNLTQCPQGKTGSYAIPAGVKTIDAESFIRTSLTSITIPASVDNIAPYAFNQSRASSYTCLASTPPQMLNNSTTVFSQVTLSNIPLTVPTSSLELYRAHSIWGQFKLPAAGTGDLMLALGTRVNPGGALGSVEGGGVFSVNTDATLTATPTAGCMFSGWMDEDGKSLGSGYHITLKVNRDRMITANFRTAYTLQLCPGNNTADAAHRVLSGEPAPAPANPARTGYAFSEWYTDTACTTPWHWSTPIMGNTTLHASWTPVPYSITYALNGGTHAGNPVEYNILTPTITLQPAARTGYTFGGWYPSADFSGGTVAAINAGSTGHVHLYAQWMPDTFDVVFSSSGLTVGRVRVPNGNTVPRPPNPQRSGYTFGGWCKDAGGQLAWSFDEDRITQTDTLYAKWTANVYSITYAHVEDAQHPNPASYTVEDGAISLNAATRTGGNFSGWWSAATGGSAVTAIPASSARDTTLYARWDTLRFNVTFDCNSCTSGNPAQQTVLYDSTASEPASTPVRDGYAFSGWYTDNGTFAVPWNFSANRVTGNVTLYARWWDTVPDVYTLIFDAAGGVAAPVSRDVALNSKVGDLPTPTRAGYTFTGWNNRANGAGKSYAKDTVYRTTANVTLYAQWDAAQCSVVFISNGSALHQEAVIHGSPVTQPADPQRSGYTFGGWHSDKAYRFAWNFGEDRITQTDTLYAKWTANVYSITYAHVEDAQHSNPASYTADDTITLKPAVRQGYSFEGWWSAATGGSAVIAIPASSARDTTLWARWKTAHTVRFNANGGLPLPPTLAVTDGNVVSEPAQLKRTGYVFVEWCSDPELTTPWDFDRDTVMEDVTLHAKWNFDTHIVHFNTNGGSSISSMAVLHSHTICPPPPTPTKDEAVFEGWYGDATLTSPWYECQGVTGEMTLYAKWNDTSNTESLIGVTVNGKALQRLPGDTTTYYYEIPCDASPDSLRIHLELPNGVESSFPYDTMMMVSRAGQHTYPVNLSSAASPSAQPKRYKFMLEKPFAFDSIVHVQLGGRLLMVIKNPEHNGEYHLQNVRWYRRNITEELLTQGKFYYSSPSGLSLSDTMFVRLQDTSGTWIASCPLTLGSEAALSEKLRGVQVAVYPNPVPAGGVVYFKEENPVQGTLEELFESVAILDVQGRRAYSGKTPELRQGLPMPTISGIYFIILKGSSGAVEIKVSVGQ
jgi:uncharacterized repeat protein (TIGR02543 family)